MKKRLPTPEPHTAHVGYTETQADYLRVRDAENWLSLDEDNIDLYKKGDLLDLNTGRDFLTETLKYEVVILHYIYHREHNSSLPAEKQSTQHTTQAWRKRLVTANAQCIIAYGGGNEVTGYYMGAIDGYEYELVSHGLWTMEKSIYELALV